MSEKVFKVSTGLEVDEYKISPSAPIDGQSLVYDGSAYIPADIVPVGTVEMWAGSSTPPDGWLLCDGTSYSWSLYTRLRDVIGVSYGGSNGVSWNVPNMTNRTLVGVAAGGALGSSSSLFGSAGTFHQHSFSTSHSSSQTTALNHTHTITNEPTLHRHNNASVSWSHNHSPGGQSVTHRHSYLRGTSSSSTTSFSAHTNHSVTSAGHNHAHNMPALTINHSHNVNNHNVSAHSHNWNDGSLGSNSGGSSHSHTVNKQSIYFIIKH
jgi:microcystin-dependent protein